MNTQEYHVLLLCRILRKNLHEQCRLSPSFALMFRCCEVDALYFRLLALLKKKTFNLKNNFQL